MTKSNVFLVILGLCAVIILIATYAKKDIDEEFFAIPEVSYIYVCNMLFDEGYEKPSMYEVVHYYNTHRASCDSVELDVECRDRLSSMLDEYCNLQKTNCEELDPIWNEIQSLPLKELQDRELDVYCEQDWYQYSTKKYTR